MKIALTQVDIIWEEKEKNKAVCEQLVREAAMHQAELIIFPEMTLTGFTMNPEKYGEHSLIQTDGSRETVRKEPERSDGKEILMKYAKIHPFSYGEESMHYCGGDSIVYACIHDICVGGFICYDLRFPEVFQISSRKNELICVIANWPESRIEHWKTLLQARAIENQCYIVGINRKGEGNGLYYPMSSMAFDPYGKRIDYKEKNFESESTLLYADIKAEIVQQCRKEFPVKEDRRENLYRELNKNLSGFQEFFCTAKLRQY